MSSQTSVLTRARHVSAVLTLTALAAMFALAVVGQLAFAERLGIVSYLLLAVTTLLCLVERYDSS